MKNSLILIIFAVVLTCPIWLMFLGNILDEDWMLAPAAWILMELFYLGRYRTQ